MTALGDRGNKETKMTARNTEANKDTGGGSQIKQRRWLGKNRGNSWKDGSGSQKIRHDNQEKWREKSSRKKGHH
jgi:hypothetical protein